MGYLNIWVANISSSSTLYAYAQFPDLYASRPNTDGVVVSYNVFGRTGNLNPLRNLGRTTTHEIGHWLSIFHPYDLKREITTPCGLIKDDGIDDTPPQLSPTSCSATPCVDNCAIFPYIDAVGSCQLNAPNGRMFMNYMDQTNSDACYNLFTVDQKDAARALFFSIPGSTKGVRADFIANYFGIKSISPASCFRTYITLQNPMCLPITWNVIGSGTITQTATANVYELTGSGTVTIEVTDGTYYIDSKTFTFSPSPTGNDGFLISGPDILCNSATYMVNATPGAAVSWSSSPVGVASIIANGAQANVTRTGSGSVTLTATLQNSCGSTSTSKVLRSLSGIQGSVYNYVGCQTYPPEYSCSPSYPINPLSTYNYLDGWSYDEYGWWVRVTVDPNSGYYGYWTASYLPTRVKEWQGSGTTLYMRISNFGSGVPIFTFNYFNACGQSGSNSFWFEWQGTGSFQYTITPNPATSDLEVAVNSKTANTVKRVDGFQEILIVDKLGNIKKRLTFSPNTKLAQINISGLKPDVYIIKIFNGKEWTSGKIQVL